MLAEFRSHAEVHNTRPWERPKISCKVLLKNYCHFWRFLGGLWILDVVPEGQRKIPHAENAYQPPPGETCSAIRADQEPSAHSSAVRRCNRPPAFIPEKIRDRRLNEVHSGLNCSVQYQTVQDGSGIDRKWSLHL